MGIPVPGEHVESPSSFSLNDFDEEIEEEDRLKAEEKEKEEYMDLSSPIPPSERFAQKNRPTEKPKGDPLDQTIFDKEVEHQTSTHGMADEMVDTLEGSFAPEKGKQDYISNAEFEVPPTTKESRKL